MNELGEKLTVELVTEGICAGMKKITIKFGNCTSTSYDSGKLTDDQVIERFLHIPQCDSSDSYKKSPNPRTHPTHQ